MDVSENLYDGEHNFFWNEGGVWGLSCKNNCMVNSCESRAEYSAESGAK